VRGPGPGGNPPTPDSPFPALPARIQALRHALEAKGILFIDSGHLAGGVIPPRG
jgi:hypothetical protein